MIAEDERLPGTKVPLDLRGFPHTSKIVAAEWCEKSLIFSPSKRWPTIIVTERLVVAMDGYFPRCTCEEVVDLLYCHVARLGRNDGLDGHRYRTSVDYTGDDAMRFLVVFLTTCWALSAQSLSLTTAGTGNSATITVVSTNQFKLVWEAADNWGLSQWYDLVNDPGGTNNVIGPFYSVNGSSAPCFAEPGLDNMVFYAVSDNKLNMRMVGNGCPYAANFNATITVLLNTTSEIILQTTASPVSGTTAPNSNIIGGVIYYIFPNGQIYVHNTVYSPTGVDLGSSGTTDLFAADMGLEDPTQTGTTPPDSQGWTRATSAENPWMGDNTTANYPYVFAYWNPSTPSPYTNWTKASIMMVKSPKNVSTLYPIIHSWAAGTGYGNIRWGYRWAPGPNIGAGQTVSTDWLIQLGTQGSSVLPNMTGGGTCAVCNTIANAYAVNPQPPASPPSSGGAPPPPVSPPVAVVISSASHVVKVGTTQSFNANGGTAPYIWSLAAGSAGSIDPSTGVYTAPSSGIANQTMAGCPVLPNDHVYNTRIDALPLNSNSASWISMIGNVALAAEVSFPLNVYNNSTPTTSMTFQYTPGANGPFPLLSAPYLAPEAGLYAPSFGPDRHILGVNTDSCQFSEIYQLYAPGTNLNCPTCNSQSGVTFNGTDYALNHGVDAAGMYLQPLALRYSELLAGTINHALRLTLSNGILAGSFVWPATSYTAEAGYVPYGTRFRMKSSVNCATYSVMMQAVCTSLKNYGMFAVDGGINGHIQTMADASMDVNTATALFSQIGNLNMSNFEVVDESSLEISASSGRVNPSNGYVTPANYAVVQVTDSASNTASVGVSIQPVTVGTKNIPWPQNAGILMVMAGTPQFQIPVIVNGTSNTAVTCSMNPSYGALTAGCLYTAPSSLSNTLDATTVTITSQADTNVSYSFPLYVFPSDAIRMHLGPKALTINNPVIPYDASGDYGPDVNGNYWWRQIGFPFWYYNQDNSYPQSSWPNGYPDVGLYYTSTSAGAGSDGGFGVMVPNGPYQIKLLFGSGSISMGSYVFGVDSQGSLLYNNQDVCTVIGTCAGFTPGTLQFNVEVTNNQLYFAERELTAGSLLNAFSITPISTCDLNGDGVVNSLDVQIAIGQALGSSSCGSADLQRNGTCNIVDVQRVINAANGQACRIGP